MSAYEWPYWSIDIPGLTEREARSVVEHLPTLGIEGEGIMVDPRFFVTVHLDRDSAQAILEALRMAQGDPNLVGDTRSTMDGLYDNFRELIAGLAG
ncbi:MAG: hypothetical protein JWP75_711 [Frondihabitans sp.]|nr:hypothetical protein [Frondihabitans sp.]